MAKLEVSDLICAIGLDMVKKVAVHTAVIGTFSTGQPFTVNHLGQKVDSDGFHTTSLTRWSNKLRSLWCVLVKKHPDGSVSVRDSKDPNKTTLEFNKDEWQSFIKGVKNGEFD